MHACMHACCLLHLLLARAASLRTIMINLVSFQSVILKSYGPEYGFRCGRSMCYMQAGHRLPQRLAARSHVSSTNPLPLMATLHCGNAGAAATQPQHDAAATLHPDPFGRARRHALPSLLGSSSIGGVRSLAARPAALPASRSVQRRNHHQRPGVQAPEPLHVFLEPSLDHSLLHRLLAQTNRGSQPATLCMHQSRHACNMTS